METVVEATFSSLTVLSAGEAMFFATLSVVVFTGLRLLTRMTGFAGTTASARGVEANAARDVLETEVCCCLGASSSAYNIDAKKMFGWIAEAERCLIAANDLCMHRLVVQKTEMSPLGESGLLP